MPYKASRGHNKAQECGTCGAWRQKAHMGTAPTADTPRQVRPGQPSTSGLETGRGHESGRPGYPRWTVAASGSDQVLH